MGEGEGTATRRLHSKTQALRFIPGLWGLVNNAGILTVGPVEWLPLDAYKKVADVNLWGLVDVTKTFLPLIKKAKGRIVIVSSIAGNMIASSTRIGDCKRAEKKSLMFFRASKRIWLSDTSKNSRKMAVSRNQAFIFSGGGVGAR